MTQFTSFVAVEEMTVTIGGAPKRIDVPVEIPEGVSYEGVFGRERGEYRMMPATAVGGMRMSAVSVAPMELAADRVRPQPSKIDPLLKGKSGKLEVRVWLKDTSAQTIEQLKNLGLEIAMRPRTAKMVIGRIAADKLSALAELKAVSYVAAM